MQLQPSSEVGALLRNSWIAFLPAGALDEEPVVPVRLLGEGLVCYRDLSGTLGLVGEFCGHQLVNLRHGYPDVRGIRCSYHDWCYDERGQCIDMPHSYGYADERIPAHPVVEVGDLLFAYLGTGPPPSSPDRELMSWCSGRAELDYQLTRQHWVHVLADLCRSAGKESNLIAPNALVRRESPRELVFVVPADEATSIMLQWREVETSGSAPRRARYVRAEADDPDYAGAIAVVGAQARAYPPEVPNCECDDDPVTATCHQELLTLLRQTRRAT